jgi:4-carboxymuconolactone decarboxylase
MSYTSVSRLPAVKREDLDENGKKAWDTVSDPSHRLYAKLMGPPGFWLHIPDLLLPVREINWYLRRKLDGLGPDLRELATLVTAREHESQYEWTAHEPHALKAGVSPAAVDVIKHRKPVAGVGEKEAAVIEFGRQLFREKKVTDDTWDRAVKALGQKGVVHMVALFSNYAMTATIFHAIGQRLRPEQTPLLPLD